MTPNPSQPPNGYTAFDDLMAEWESDPQRATGLEEARIWARKFWQEIREHGFHTMDLLIRCPHNCGKLLVKFDSNGLWCPEHGRIKHGRIDLQEGGRNG